MKTNFDIQKYLTDQPGISRVLELGAGKSTVQLSKEFTCVSAIEHDSKYIGWDPGVDYIYAPLVPYKDKYFRDATFWYDVDKIKKCLRDHSYDAIIVDGPKGSQGRGGFFTNLELFKTDLYIFDDTHRLWDFRLAGRVADHFDVPFETYTNGYRWFSVVRKGRRMNWKS